MAVDRRGLLGAFGVLAASVVLAGHTPYRQWAVYRRKHLLLLTHRGDPEGVELARAMAERLASRVPSSKARITRAPHLHRVASLLATDQLQFAVLTPQDAATMRAGAPPLEAYGRVPLTRIGALGHHVLVARADVPDRHAWLLADGLDGVAIGSGRFAVAGASGAGTGDLPAHPGARAYAGGRPMPGAAAPAGDHAHE